MQVSTLVSLITNFNKAQEEAFASRTRELFSDLEIEPTVDKDGRYHAPVDGYITYTAHGRAYFFKGENYVFSSKH